VPLVVALLGALGAFVLAPRPGDRRYSTKLALPAPLDFGNEPTASVQSRKPTAQTSSPLKQPTTKNQEQESVIDYSRMATVLLAKFMSDGVRVSAKAPPEARFIGSLVGGAVAVFSATSLESILEDLIAAAPGIPPLAAMHPEVGAVMKQLASHPAVTKSIAADEDPLFALIEVVSIHPAFTQLGNLFEAMPTQAAELAVATGILVALRVSREQPELARAIIASKPD
jgi:hypothetical protein